MLNLKEMKDKVNSTFSYLTVTNLHKGFLILGFSDFSVFSSFWKGHLEIVDLISCMCLPFGEGSHRGIWAGKEWLFVRPLEIAWYVFFFFFS